VSYWKPEPTYPPYAKTLTFKAVESQISRWDAAAAKYNRGSRGAFIAWAVDLACFFLEAQDRARQEHQQEMHLWDRDRKE
jgi:hypothetical protein